jgi:hypothetical protein
MVGINDQGETQRAEDRANRHDPMSAVAVDQATDARRNETRCKQRQRKAAHGKAHRPAALTSNQWHGQNRRIEDRTPGQNLGNAEHEDGAPGAGDHVTHDRHEGHGGREKATLARRTRASS